MNVNQMHLAIQQGVDKINSLQADMLLPQEIDIELNKSMSRFLNTKYGKNNIYRKGFEESQKRIDDLRSLVMEYEAPVVFKEQYNNNFWIDQFRLPSDYLYLVNQRSEIFTNNCNPISYSLDDNNPTSYFVLPFDNLHNGTDMTESIVMAADPADLTLGTAYLASWPNTWTYPQDIQQLKDHLLDSTNWGTGFEIYWEMYGQLHHPNSFIVIVDTNTYPWFNWDSSVTTNVSPLQTTLLASYPGSTGPTDPSYNEYVYGQYSENSLGAKRLPSGDSTREFTFNKFIQHDDIFKLLDDPFNTTKHTSPLTTMRGEYIDIYTSDIFIIDKVKITYIRKPKQISLSLGISCELPEHTHQEIVDRTVSSILEGISDPRYQTHQSEVGKNE
tara:strand:- start:4 stop:1161 length:1158 start_codon:yes stop_codon:yes gene_type:complete